MTQKPRTGSVKGRRVKARGDIVTGILIDGKVGDATLQAALQAMKHLSTGDVIGAEMVEAGGRIVAGFSYLNPASPDREAFIRELRALREQVAALAADPGAGKPAREAAQAADEALAEAEKPQPAGTRLKNRLGELVEFLTHTGKALQAADQAAPLVFKAVSTAAALYQIAEALF